MNLTSAFAAVAKRHPAKTAIFWGDREIPYQELLNQSHWVAGELATRFGVKPGARVGLWLKNCPEFMPALFGILGAGAVAVPINNFLKTPEVSYILEDAGIRIVVTDRELGHHETSLKRALPGLQFLHVESIPAQFASEPLALNAGRARKNDDLALLIYTSGTTGRPKGAMLSHGNLLHNVESCRIVLQTVEGDRIAVMLPLFHSYMLTVGLLLPLLVGGSMVLIKSLHPIRSALQEMLQRSATVLPAIPQFYRSVLNAAVPGHLPFRIFVSGAAPLPAQVLLDFEAKFKAPLIEGYGLSEASPVVTKNPLNGSRKPGSIGLPITNVEVTIQDDLGRILPPQQVGELCVKGGNVMLGYWNRPEDTAKAFRHGWLLTGDLGYKDDDGFFFITDRKKDMLLVNGINVYPREIEEVIHRFRGVKEAAVIGKPDPRRGEEPVAFVAAEEGATLDEKELKSFLKRNLADYKVPRRLIMVESLPRNATGKILKTELRKVDLG